MQSYTVEISGVGRLTTSLSCEIFTENSVLVPLNKNIRNVQADVIPENPKVSVISLLAEILPSVLPQNVSNLNQIKNLNSLAHKAIEINNLQRKSLEPLFIFKVEFHFTVMYISILLITLTISIVVVKFKNQVIKMYSPEVADNIPNNEQVNP